MAIEPVPEMTTTPSSVLGLVWMGDARRAPSFVRRMEPSVCDNEKSSARGGSRAAKSGGRSTPAMPAHTLVKMCVRAGEGNVREEAGRRDGGRDSRAATVAARMAWRVAVRPTVVLGIGLDAEVTQGFQSRSKSRVAPLRSRRELVVLTNCLSLLLPWLECHHLAEQ
jgi:hypothetical protein